ncbi:MAG: cadherin repeat domain-containing protein, partial [Bacteroidia bacterium]|nr:cadherin repeat domain-containing protein [Bacteroidia bacterium]
MNFKHYILITLAFLLQKISFAAAPTWSVTPSSYQYSMTATAVANINCAELANPSNKIGAFVGGVCRGVSNTSTVVSGKYLASLVIYSSLSSGETVTFKIYNAVTDVVTDAVTTVSFQDNATFGVSSSPFVVLNNNAPTALNISNSSILESASIGTVVGNLTSTDVDLSQTYTYTLVSGAGSTDNSKFSILGGQLKTAANYIYSVQNSFNIRVRTTDNLNCSFEQTFTLNLIDVNTAPIGIYISDSTINENASILTNFGAFTALDNDTGEIFTYTLVAGVG